MACVLLRLLTPLIWILMALAIAVFVFRTKQGAIHDRAFAKRSLLKGSLAITVIALGLVIGFSHFAGQVRRFSALGKLAPDTVDYVDIADHRVTNSTEFDPVIAALRSSQWYVHTSSDGGWAQPVNITVHLRSGHIQQYSVARLLRGRGAVVDFITQEAGSNFIQHHGLALSLELPAALEQIGSRLPAAK